MVLHIFLTYKNFIFQAFLSLLLTLTFTFLKVPTLFLHGLFTYIHPDNVNSGVRAAIKRPESPNSSSGTGTEIRKRNKLKEKNGFDENNAQIFRLKLDEEHLQTRIFFREYYNAFTFTFVGIACLSLQNYLGVTEKVGVLANGIFIPVLFGLLAVLKVFLPLAKVSFEKSASRRLDKQLSLLFGSVGFVLGLVVLSLKPSILDFQFGEIDGIITFFISMFMGCLSGFLYRPASMAARSFWLGTDQIRCSLEMIHCGWFSRMALYLNFILVNFTTLLWINPFTDILISQKIGGKVGESAGGNVGFSKSDMAKVRLWCLFFSGFLQIVAIRPNLQMYLNEALLSWYQRLHGGKVPDLDFSRAKVFLHNHYLCLAVLQFFSPAAFLLLFAGLSQINCESLEASDLVSNLLLCNGFFKELGVFLAWWIVFVWSVFSSGNILLYRHGTRYVS